jgi:hypothetical protein
MATETSNIRNKVEEFVKKDPKYTAGVIQKWMREKEPEVVLKYEKKRIQKSMQVLANMDEE